MRFDIDDITEFFMKAAFFIASIALFIISILYFICVTYVVWSVIKC